MLGELTIKPDWRAGLRCQQCRDVIAVYDVVDPLAAQVGGGIRWLVHVAQHQEAVWDSTMAHGNVQGNEQGNEQGTCVQ